MDALSPPHPARRVAFIKAAQVCGIECGNNWIGYVIHHAPSPMLGVQPTTGLANRFSRQRIDPLVEETPAIRERVAPARSRDSGNRQLSKEFPGGQLVMTGANSAVGLRSMSAQFLFLDEIDAYPGDVEGEGDPIALAACRIPCWPEMGDAGRHDAVHPVQPGSGLPSAAGCQGLVA
jgi:phage terminase large subunit GpA-like protein